MIIRHPAFRDGFFEHFKISLRHKFLKKIIFSNIFLKFEWISIFHLQVAYFECGCSIIPLVRQKYTKTYFGKHPNFSVPFPGPPHPSTLSSSPLYFSIFSIVMLQIFITGNFFFLVSRTCHCGYGFIKFKKK